MQDDIDMLKEILNATPLILTFLFPDDAPPFPTGVSNHGGAQSYSAQFPVPAMVNVKDEWTPVSHGNPMSDDATLYYAPPSLERVRITSRYNDDNPSCRMGKKPIWTLHKGCP